jgi:hypothetical protein
MTTTAAKRDETLRSLTDMVKHFDPSNAVQRAHFLTLAETFGEMWAAMLVSQDVHHAAADPGRFGAGHLELTDAGAINSYVGWTKANRVVRHGSVARYTVFDFEADTKVGGRVVKMFTRDQTVPAYAQPE